MKKFLSVVLALTMVLSLTATAFASQTAELTDGLYTGSLEIEGTVNLPTIEISLPSSGEVILNPYKIDYEVDASTTVQDQVISAVQYIENGSEVDVKMTFTAEAITGGDVELVDRLTNGSTAKEVTLSLNFKAAANTTTITGTTITSADDSFDLSEGEFTLESDDAITLAATDDATGTANDTLAFNLSGTANAAPEAAWTEDDTVSVNIAFSFEPVAAS